VIEKIMRRMNHHLHGGYAGVREQRRETMAKQRAAMQRLILFWNRSARAAAGTCGNNQRGDAGRGTHALYPAE
jgi:hypothetical protein